jgi:hypothetical protein
MAAIEPGAPARPFAPRQRRATRAKATFPYLNRELSWLEFTQSAMRCGGERTPLLERQVPCTRRQPRRVLQVGSPGYASRSRPAGGAIADGRTADEQLAAAQRGPELVADHLQIFVSSGWQPRVSTVRLRRIPNITTHLQTVRRRSFGPYATVVDPGHPLPKI